VIPGFPSTGPLEETPEFAAEEHLGPALATLCAALGFVMHALAMLPGLAATFAIMGESYSHPN
jgi:hypothetical protein